jgi:hypothetical protein
VHARFKNSMPPALSSPQTLNPLPTQVNQKPVKMWGVEQALGGWAAAQRKFFDAGQILDRIQSEVGARRMERGKAGAVVQRHKAV